MLETITDQGVHRKIIRIILNTVCIKNQKVKLERKELLFPILKGVKQEDPLISNLFDATLEAIFTKINWKYHRIKINWEHLSNLRFMDDIVLLANRREDI